MTDTAFKLRQSLFLLITATIWGLSFVAQSVGMEHVGPFTFTASRMALGVLCLLPWILWRRSKGAGTPKGKGKTLLWGGILCGACLFAGESLQQFGLVHDTEVGKAGFITALYIVLVPLMSALLGKRPSATVWAGVAAAVAGLWFLCVPSGGFSLRIGDVYTFLCAFVFAVHILIIGRFVGKVDAIELSCAQFAVGSLLACSAAGGFETPSLAGIDAALPAILWAGVMSNGIAYTLQIVGQKGMNETVASLIMSLESAVAVIAGWAILHEVLSSRELFGCLLMAAAVVLAQLPSPKGKGE